MTDILIDIKSETTAHVQPDLASVQAELKRTQVALKRTKAELEERKDWCNEELQRGNELENELQALQLAHALQITSSQQLLHLQRDLQEDFDRAIKERDQARIERDSARATLDKLVAAINSKRKAVGPTAGEPAAKRAKTSP